MLNIKELHIGAHVLIDGKRERVRGMDEDNGLIIRFPAEYVLASDIEPIPITPELLTELGFEYHTSLGSWRKEQTAGTPFIGIDELHDGLWRVNVANDIYVYGNILCKYLHQAESFLYLTTKTELIKE